MKNYYFNNFVNAHGKHEIHSEGCPYLSYSSTRTYIGYFSSCDDALKKAKSQYPGKSFVCFSCSDSCPKD
ncbi:MAG TPA: hypothetical protein DDY58_06000 [Terrisporobacter glycolicus]|nr:hypothetical protein [Terrisporobacter hibernicus]